MGSAPFSGGTITLCPLLSDQFGIKKCFCGGRKTAQSAVSFAIGESGAFKGQWPNKARARGESYDDSVGTKVKVLYLQTLSTL